MKVYFVGGSITGGSGFSHREFARGLTERGHDVTTLTFASRWKNIEETLYGQLLARTQRPPIPSRMRPVFRRLYQQLGRRPSTETQDGVHHWTSPVPENAFLHLVGRSRPDVVVVRSMRSRSIRQLAQSLKELNIPWVYRVSETLAIDQLVESGEKPMITLGNARTHERRLTELGFTTTYVPQMRHVHETLVESSRQVALLINPIPMLGVDTVWELAAERPDIEFVLQESWPLSEEAVEQLVRRASSLGNVTLRRFLTDRRKLYEDARVLLTPHRVDNNPRTAIEAHANAIPVISSNLPGLLEVVGDGGVTLPLDAGTDVWVNALATMWDEPARYGEFCRAALAYYEHPDNDVERTLDLFEQALTDAVDEL